MKYSIFRVLVDKGVIDIPDNATVIGYESGKTHSYNGTIGHSVIRNVHYAICMMPYREVEDDYDLEEEEHPAPELGNPIVPPIYKDMFEKKGPCTFTGDMAKERIRKKVQT